MKSLHGLLTQISNGCSWFVQFGGIVPSLMLLLHIKSIVDWHVCSPKYIKKDKCFLLQPFDPFPTFADVWHNDLSLAKRTL